MTSKELGMAVADRLRQAEKRPETPGSEPTAKHHAHRRRMLQPPTREQQSQHSQKDALATPAPVNPDNHNGTQEYIIEGYKPGEPFWTRERVNDVRASVHALPPFTDEEWKEYDKYRESAYKFADEMVSNELALAPDAEWERLQRIEPGIYNAIKETKEKKNRIRELKEQAGGDEKVLKELWEKEKKKLIAIRYEDERKKQEEKEVNSRKLPSKEESREQVDKKLAELGDRPLTDERWAERERMMTKDPKTLTKEEWQGWRRNPASLTEEDVRRAEEMDKLRAERREKELKKRETYGWGDDPGTYVST